MLPLQMDVNEFGTKLNEVLSPARPIQSVEHLTGRTAELSRIKKALFAAGRHIFIYGDRGVGKSSLAAAANLCQSTDAEYIDIGCSPDATLKSIVANIAYVAVNASRLRKTKLTSSASVELRFLKAGLSAEVTMQDLHSEIHTMLDAVSVLREVAAIHSERPVVVLDEFDRIADSKERNMFADLVKQLGDKKVGITFFFTGVGKTDLVPEKRTP
jgi:MoxR-like ATPase